MKEIRIDPGLEVYCDFCSEDYTNSDQPGGVIFSSYAICPQCYAEKKESIDKYKRVHRPCVGMSFANLVRAYRMGDFHYKQAKNKKPPTK